MPAVVTKSAAPAGPAAAGDLAAALAALERRPTHLGAAWLLAEWLGTHGQGGAAARLLASLARAAANLGEAGIAVAAAVRFAAQDPESADAKGLLAEVAAVFAAGSGRLGKKKAPPPLKRDADLPEASAETGDAEVSAARALETVERVAPALDAVRAATAKEPIAAVPLLSTLAPGLLVPVLGAMRPVSLEAGETLFRRGAKPDAVHLVACGTLAVRLDAADGVSTTIARVRAGVWVGELSLVTGTARTADVLAETRALLLRLDRAHVERLATLQPGFREELVAFARRRLIEALLATSPLLSKAPPASRERLLSRFRVRTYQSGAEILGEAQEGDGLYLVANGEVAISSRAAGDLGRLGPGSVFGEVSLVLRKPATATVRAVEPTIVLHLDRDDFFVAIRERPELMVELYDLALARADARLTVLGTATPDEGDAPVV